MIITRIVGGLGNQLFCYAAGKALAKRLNVSLKIDIDSYRDYKLHDYALHHFNIKAHTAAKHECIATNPPSPFKKLLSYFPWSQQKISLYQEPSFLFNNQMLNQPDQTYLSGYWQSEQYFAAIENELREDLKFKENPCSLNANFLEKIRAGHSVSVHIRRGDYISNPDANAVHGTCDLEYYLKATQLLQEKLHQKPLNYFIFSDDPTWVKNNLKLNGEMIFVTHNNGSKNHEDLRLMSACRHHIIANSTFSWWGAWLNPSLNKIVIAPKQWFKDPHYNCRDLIPSTWVRV